MSKSNVRASRRRVGKGALSLLVALGVSLPAAAVAAVAAATPAYASGPTITGAGSSYASVAIDQWVAEISSLDGDNVNYSVSSSVTGLNEFAQQQVNFGASEIGYSTNQANYTPPAGYAYQYLPDVAGATCLDYNLQSQITGEAITNLQLTSAMILGIFTGTITTWGQLDTGGLNQELQGDSAPITTVFRTDASGENYILSDYLDTLDPSAWASYTSALNFPGGPQAIWPFPQGNSTHAGYNFSNWNGEDGSDQASQYVYSNAGSITYVETAYALAHHDPCAAVQNKGGAYVQPSAYADAVALLKATLEPDLEQLLTGVFIDTNPQAYPISAYSYLVTPEGQMNAAQGAVLGQFVEFLACQGQQSAEQLGYSPLPPNLVDDDFAGIKRINGAAPPPASVNASTCNDPYVNLGLGSGSGEGSGASIGSGPQTTTNTGPSTGPTSNNTTSPNANTQTNNGNGNQSTNGRGSNNGGATNSKSSKGNGRTVAGISSSGGPQSPTTTTTTDPNVGLALYEAAGAMNGVPKPIAPMILISIGLLLLIAIPPSIAFIARRRRRIREAM